MRGSFENLFFAVNVCFSQIEERTGVASMRVSPEKARGRIG